jgi:hypothetical protein
MLTLEGQDVLGKLLSKFKQYKRQNENRASHVPHFRTLLSFSVATLNSSYCFLLYSCPSLRIIAIRVLKGCVKVEVVQEFYEGALASQSTAGHITRLQTSP